MNYPDVLRRCSRFLLNLLDPDKTQNCKICHNGGWQGRKVTPMTSINISLPEFMKTYVEQQVVTGGYGTISEYFHELIRQDQKRKAKEQIECLLLEGLDSEPATVMTDLDWEEIRQSVRDKIVQRNNSNLITDG